MEQVLLEHFALLRHRWYMLDKFLETRDQEHVSVDKIGMQHDANELQRNTNSTVARPRLFFCPAVTIIDEYAEEVCSASQNRAQCNAALEQGFA